MEEQKLLIEKFVKANKNFKGNEDLLEDFCSEAMQKSYMIFNSTSNVQKIESYVSKVVHTSILSVLKDYGRMRRESGGYVATKEVKVADFTAQVPSKSQLTINNPSFVLEFPDPRESAEEILITKDCLQRIADAVCIIHKEVPQQQFLDIFYMRYVKGLKQAEIAKNLKLSQPEISKRLMQLAKMISNFLEGNGRS